jgi:transposase InsO family protein
MTLTVIDGLALERGARAIGDQRMRAGMRNYRPGLCSQSFPVTTPITFLAYMAIAPRLILHAMSFVGIYRVERAHHRIYGTRAEARRDLFQYIEGFYNSRRLHSALGYVNPAFAERMAA